jgi:hypothetical protein
MAGKSIDYRASIKESLMSLQRQGNSLRPDTFDATVVSVDESSRTCVVNSDNRNIDALTVRLIPEISDGFLLIPAEESTVTVSTLGPNFAPIVIAFTELEKIILTVKDQGYLNDGDIQMFNDGKFGGLVKVKETAKKIKALEEKYNSLLSSIKAIIVPLAPTGTYPFGPEFAANTPISPITKVEDLENPKITHGEKIEQS